MTGLAISPTQNHHVIALASLVKQVETRGHAVTSRAADLALAQFSRFIGFVAEKASRNLRFQDLLKSNYNVFWSESFLSCNRRIGV
jgi:hypothetical protein